MDDLYVIELRKKIKELEAQLEKAESVIRFYADKESWNFPDEAGPHISLLDHEKINYEESDGEEYLWIMTGGKKAREYFEDKNT